MRKNTLIKRLKFCVFYMWKCSYSINNAKIDRYIVTFFVYVLTNKVSAERKKYLSILYINQMLPKLIFSVLKVAFILFVMAVFF